MKHFCTICGKPTIYNLSLPKFCSNCGNEFSLVTKEKDKSAGDQALEKLKNKYSDNNREFIPVTKAPPKKYPNPTRASFRIVDESTTVSQQHEEDRYDDDYDDEDSEYVDISNLTKVKPKFTVQHYRNTSESFENIITQSYASNYKPVTNEESNRLSIDAPTRNAESILEEFRREAGSNRANQDQ